MSTGADSSGWPGPGHRRPLSQGMLLGRVAVRETGLTMRLLNDALALQERLRAIGGESPPLGHILKDLDLLSAEEVAWIKQQQLAAETPGDDRLGVLAVLNNFSTRESAPWVGLGRPIKVDFSARGVYSCPSRVGLVGPSWLWLLIGSTRNRAIINPVHRRPDLLRGYDYPFITIRTEGRNLMDKKIITVIPGDGVGPEITAATLRVLAALKCDLDYEEHLAGVTALEAGKKLVPEETLESISRNAVALKGPLATPVGEGFTSINVQLRKHFDLYANVRPAITRPGVQSRYKNIDILTIRENTEGMYHGERQTLSADGSRAESVSVITREGAQRILRFAYDLAQQRGRQKITVVHKANILKATSGLFLEVARETAVQFPDIETVEMIVDNTCMQLVMNPHQFDVIVTTNLFGDILSDLCAGLIGGLGMAPGANIGDRVALFEAVHGSAPDIAGKNIANPSALMLAAALMLDHLNMTGRANSLRQAIRQTIADGDRLTRDLGGEASTDEYTDAVISRV